MAITISPTPNPNALKFEVGKDVGGPQTFAAGEETDDPMASALLGLPGVTSVFLIADFVTVTKGPAGSWEEIAEEAKRIIGEHFAD